MEDLVHLDRLQEESQKVIAENKNSRESRNNVKQEYLKLKEKLSTLADKVSYPTAVPVGSVGFFQGELIHTNEIMVLLGDNWFVERSTKQATEIVDRRIEMIDKQLADLQKEYDNFQSRVDFTKQFQQIKQEHDGVKEIKEELPSSFEMPQKGKRIAHKPKHNVTPRPVKFGKPTNGEVLDNPVLDTNDQSINHDELLARLNELEKLEQEESQLEHNTILENIMTGKYQKTSTRPKDNLACNGYKDLANEKSISHHVQRSLDESILESSKRVKFRADVPTDQATSRREDQCDDTNVITFSHTNNCQRERSASESDVRRKYGRIMSPSDIYEQYASRDDENDKPLKSILKKDSRSNSTENLKLKPILKTSPEHRPGTPEHTLEDPKPILKTPPDTQGSDRRPGTPEYVFLDEPKPILKSSTEANEKPQTADHISEEPRPILKTQEVYFLEDNEYTPNHNDSMSEEVKSILKTNDSPSKRPGTPDEDRKSILKSPTSKSRDVRTAEPEQDFASDPRPILKHGLAEVQAFSGQVVERNVDSSDWKPAEQERQPTKPISKFKASRMKK